MRQQFDGNVMGLAVGVPALAIGKHVGLEEQAVYAVHAAGLEVLIQVALEGLVILRLQLIDDVLFHDRGSYHRLPNWAR